jgi:hypothetical protein
MKEYKIKKTKGLIKKLKPYWKELKKLEDGFLTKVIELEEKMQKEVGINDLEFFHTDDGYIGIGNIERTMELIHGEDFDNR